MYFVRNVSVIISYLNGNEWTDVESSHSRMFTCFETKKQSYAHFINDHVSSDIPSREATWSKLIKNDDGAIRH